MAGGCGAEVVWERHVPRAPSLLLPTDCCCGNFNLSARASTAAPQVYEGIRAMFEGYSRNKHRTATGVIQWMLNSGA